MRHQWRGDLLLQQLRDAHRVFHVPKIRRDENEFVTAEAGESVGGADAVGETPGERAQHLVTHRMAEGVIDSAEAVDVDIKQRQLRSRAARQRESDCQAVFEESAVRQARERVVVSLMLESHFDSAALGDVMPQTDKARDRAGLVAQRMNGRFHPYRLGFRAFQSVGNRAVILARQNRALHRRRFVEVLFAHKRLKRRSNELLRLTADQLPDLRRDIREDAAIVDRPVDVRRPFGNETQQRLGCQVIRSSVHDPRATRKCKRTASSSDWARQNATPCVRTQGIDHPPRATP